MNKTILKNLACESRVELIEKVRTEALKYDIYKDGSGNTDFEAAGGIVLSSYEKLQRKKIIEEIRIKGNGYEKIIERIAYEWFSRFIALRYMEVNDYLPTGVRALSSSLPGAVEPDLIRYAFEVKLPVDAGKIYEMKLKGSGESLFKYMIIAQCNSLSGSLPFIFEEPEDSSELLFPEGLLKEGNFIRKLTDTSLIPEGCWKDVTIIGWLYEYYISGEKNKLMKSKKKYDKEEIPYVTQLFTPDWIVKYMVENSLGRYWIEAHPEQCDLKGNWEFYIENSQAGAYEKLYSHIDRKLKVENIKCLDPACGSGHILIYMFDVLYQIYKRCGYRQEEIPELIMENNLYGMDIDDKAYKLACFAVIMQGMKYNKRLLENIERKNRSGQCKNMGLNIVSIQESNALKENDIAYIAGERTGENYNRTKLFIDAFKNAKIYGALIQLEKFEKGFFTNRLKYIIDNPEDNLTESRRRGKIIKLLAEFIKQAGIMSETYDILVTNPPYMGNRYFNPLLGKYISQKYPEVKTDMFSAFMLYSFSKVRCNGHLGFMVPFVWMFIQSYETLRKIIIDSKNISSLIQLEYSGFEEATVPVCTFTVRNYSVDMPGDYIKLSDFKGARSQPEKTRKAILNPLVDYRFTVNQDKMKKIPGNRFGYWLTDGEIEVLNRARVMAHVAYPCTGMQTGSNHKYIRQWFEVDYNLIDFFGENGTDKYWVPYQMGGEAKKWYGNISEVIYWKDGGHKVREEKGSVIRNEKFFFHKGISWKRITSGRNTIRVLEKGFIFDQSADSIFVKDEGDYNYILSFFNTKIMANIFEFIAPTLNLTAGTVRQIPIYMEQDPSVRRRIDLLCRECIAISKNNWDSFETSWNFKRPTLLLYKGSSDTIEEAYCNWRSFSQGQFYRMKCIERKLNEIFIRIYGFENEMTAEIEEKDITIERANRERDIKSFISYAVGCMFGRYSLDREGIVYAGGKFNSQFTVYDSPSKGKICRVRKTGKDDEGNNASDFWTDASFPPEMDNIIPILRKDYFKNDIVCRFVEFVRTAFGEKNLSRNLDFIAETLKKKRNESSRDAIRRYFINEFFKDHARMYRGRPIYWLFTSGKQRAFNCLIYMHRYKKGVLSKIKGDYLDVFRDKLYGEKIFLSHILDKNCSKYERNYLEKEILILSRKTDELKKYGEMLHHMENMQVEIHMDDGVKANYNKFKSLLK